MSQREMLISQLAAETVAAECIDKQRIHSIVSGLRNAVMPLRLQVLAVDDTTREILESVSVQVEALANAFVRGANRVG